MANISKQRGQLILMALVMLGGAIFAAVGIVGYFTRLQVRQATNIVHSTMAIYAADAGIEQSRFVLDNCSLSNPLEPLDYCFSKATIPPGGKITLNNGDGASFYTEVGWVNTTPPQTTFYIKSFGDFLDTYRILELIRGSS